MEEWKIRGFRIPDDIYEILIKESKKLGISKAEIIRKLIKELDEKRRRN